MGKADSLYQRAVEIASKAHEGQKDKGGNPYFWHALAVAEKVQTPELKIVAILHDVLEDTSMTYRDLLREGFPEELVEAVKLLTHEKTDEQSYEKYILRVKRNPIARLVKLADLSHNMDLSRIPDPKPEDYERCEKYRRAYRCLTEEE